MISIAFWADARGLCALRKRWQLNASDQGRPRAANQREEDSGVRERVEGRVCVGGCVWVCGFVVV